jgi:hypothetical protein
MLERHKQSHRRASTTIGTIAGPDYDRDGSFSGALAMATHFKMLWGAWPHIEGGFLKSEATERPRGANFKKIKYQLILIKESAKNGRNHKNR